MKVYRYRLNTLYIFRHRCLTDIHFKNQWLSISQSVMEINTSYAWDGCTPKWQPFGLFTVGVPDGADRFGKPWLYYPSLVHDVLCQFRHQIPLSQRQATQIFDDHLLEIKWPLRRLYVWGVKYLGPQDFKIN